MTTRESSRRSKAGLSLFAVALSLLAIFVTGTLAAEALPGSPAEERHDHRRVVVLHSYHAGFTWSHHISQGIQEILSPRRDEIELCFEYMDSRRLSSEMYYDSLARFLAWKYQERPVDLVLACDDNAFSFMMSRGSHLFGPVPFLFCSVSGFQPERLAGRRITGLQESIDISSTLQTALDLHPGVETVHVVLDSSPTGQALKAKAKSAFRPFHRRVRFRYLDKLSQEEILRELAVLGRQDLVLLFIFPPDHTGRVVSHEVILHRVAPTCHAPIYSVWDFYLGHGIVGGKLCSGRAEGRMVGELALRVLAGEEPASIPVQESPTQSMFDHRQLERFEIRPRDLPPSAVIEHRPRSLWAEYRRLIQAVAVSFVFLVVMVLSLLLAIRKRRRIEKALRESREQLDLALRGADLGLWDLDIPVGVFRIDRLYGELVAGGAGEGELSYTAMSELIHPEDRDAAHAVMTRHLEGLEPQLESEHRMRHSSGRWVWALIRGRVVEWDDSGRPLRSAGTYLDITARKQEEEKRIELERQVQHVQKLESLGVLAGGIAHDFNNLLTGIMGNASLAVRSLPEGVAGTESLRGIQKAAARAANLCRQLLAYSGRGKFIMEDIDLSRIVGEMTHLLEVSISKKADLRYDLAEDLPLIRGDATQIGQVVMNLITNASEALGQRSGIVRLRTGTQSCAPEYLREMEGDQELEGGAYVFLEVSDDGCGMSKETQQKVFDPFFTTKFTGRGLGLSAVLGIVRGHHGAMKLYSEEGKGTTFKVLFPARRVDQPAGMPSAETEFPVPEPFGHGTVLVVDDDAVVRSVAQQMLRHMGFQVLVAEDGVQALEVFTPRADTIRCVLLDLTMPNMDGEECFRELRRLRPGVKVILSSGYNVQEATHRFTGKGLAGFIQKPYVYETLAAGLRQVLEE